MKGSDIVSGIDQEWEGMEWRSSYLYPCNPNRLQHDSPLFDEMDKDIGWIAERKMNGWRCLAFKDKDRLYLMTKHKTLIKDPLPDLRDNLCKIMPGDTMLDGELIDKRTSGIKKTYYLFDALKISGEDITGWSWSKRRERLEGLVDTARRAELILLSVPVEVGKKNLYYQAIGEEGCEGIVMKKKDSKYLASKTSCQDNPFWIKVKKDEAYIKLNEKESEK